MSEDSVRDWLIPLKHNIWIQMGVFCVLIAVTSPMLIKLTPLNDNQLFLAIWLSLLIASIFLGFSTFGHGTVKAYRKTRAHIKKYKRLDPRFQKAYSRHMYCSRTGVRVAAVRYGHTRHLNSRIANRWLLI